MFFQTINRMITTGTDLSINIRQVNDKLTVAVMPRRAGLKDEAGEQIVPLVLNGTPEELDMEFLGAITAPVQKAQGILTNLETFEKQAEQAVSQSKAAKSVAEKESKEVREKREKMEKLLKKAEDATGGKRYSEALTWLRQAKRLAMPDKQKEIDVKIAEVQKKASEGSLFGAEPIMPEPQPAQVIQPVAPQPVPGHAPRYQGGEQIRMFAPEQPSRQSPHQIPRSVQGTQPQQVPHGQAASRPGADGTPAGCQQPVNRPYNSTSRYRYRNHRYTTVNGCNPSLRNRKRLPRKPFPITKGKANTGHERRTWDSTASTRTTSMTGSSCVRTLTRNISTSRRNTA